MVPMTRIIDTVAGTIDEWRRLRWEDLHFAEARTAILVLTVLAATAVLVIIARRHWSRTAARWHVALPSLLPRMRRSRASGLRHTAFALFLTGLPFFAIALAEPYTSFRRDDVSYLGRRIAMIVDASTSMTLKFDTAKLKTTGGPAYFTAVAAAEYFMRQRMAGPYHDLIALIQFGNEAYVVTPFTTDYENITLSLRLISDPRDWGRFSDWGTTIVHGIEQGLSLFQAFDFLNASGNCMLIFTDGRDDQVTVRGGNLDKFIKQSRQYKIPIYMLRTAFNMNYGEVRQDKIWQPAIDATGGRFYAIPNEAAMLKALDEIDRLSAGKIERREYTANRPRFAGYALVAVALWLGAAAMKFSVPYFSTFP
jgi:hypothetical protein